ncbi:MAG: hypothetical protein KGS61_06570 [Verrucomicrobia bacterium]|nr:hypothetical protein [Verrucomicrobiota bacterium]
MNAASSGLQVDLDTAVKTALNFFRASFGSMKLSDVQLEEIELSEDERYWLITVGYDNPTAVDLSRGKMVLPFPMPVRKYKVVRVDARTGRPVSIKIRQGV